MRRNHNHTPKLIVNCGILNDAWESHRASCFCDITRVCHSLVRVRITAVHMLASRARLFEAGCPPFESSVAKVHVQPTVTTILNRFTS